MYSRNDYRDYLEHHGIKNQKWGVQNGPPYPLNTEGKKKFSERLADRRKAKKRAQVLKKARKVRAKNVAQKAKEEAKIKKTATALSPTPIKSIKKMSNQELETRIKRLQMEKQLRELEAGEKSRAVKMIEDGLYEGGKRLISSVVSEAGMRYVRDAFGQVSAETSKKDKKKKDGGTGTTITKVKESKRGNTKITRTVEKKR